MAQPQQAQATLPDHPDDVAALKLLFTRALAGVAEVVKVVKLIEAEQARLAKEAPGTSSLASRRLENARTQYRAILARASALAAQAGVIVPVDQLVAVDMSGDVGAIDPNSKMGKRLTEEGTLGVALDAAPGAGIIIMGEKLALRALAKVGLRKAIQAGGAFARASAAGARAAGRVLMSVGGKFIALPAVIAAVTAAVQWFTAALAIRLAAPGAAGALGNLLSTPGGLVLGALALYLFLNRR